MAMGTLNWEDHLLSMVHEVEDVPGDSEPHLLNEQLCLDDAYAYCQKLTQVNSRTFYLASSLLPKIQQRGVWALYSFCRVCDDLVDRSQAPDPESELQNWSNRTINAKPDGDDCVALAWADTRHRFEIPWRYARQLIRGVALDFSTVRYETFDNLAIYCYGVACTVGLMSMHIIGYSGPQAIPYALRMGVALQLTNILRDVGEDYRAGRIYLPRQELDAFGVSEDVIAAGIVTPQWREFMRLQIDRGRPPYDQGIPGIAYLDPSGRFAIAAAARLYQGILKKVEDNDYDVFHRRAAVSSIGKISMLPAIWWQAKTVRADRT
jgi:15-cis-phytoene synthase